MNFDSQLPVDTLLSRLLAFVIMFQKNIEFIKCKLAGNQQFHTRLAFQKLDENKRNELSPQLLSSILRKQGVNNCQEGCYYLIQRYSRNSGLNYEEFLKLVTPKGNKILSQRMMIRTYKKGTVLEDYLYHSLLQLLQLYVKMSSITQQLRRAIQKNEDINHVELIDFFRQRLSSSDKLISFFSICGEKGEEYDISSKDTVYLSYHIQSGDDIIDFNDLDIKQLICPLDMNFTKNCKNTFNNFKTILKEQTNPAQTKSTNFLGKTYQKLYHNHNSNQNSNQSSKFVSKVVNQIKPSFISQLPSARDQSYGGMYLDNFIRSDLQPKLQINRLLRQKIINSPDKRQIFEDDLNSYSSSVSRSRDSAFDRS